jgi:hypothetical protein
MAGDHDCTAVEENAEIFQDLPRGATDYCAGKQSWTIQ